ncbi:MAG: bacteriohemerythrin [Sulfuricurvum sp.]|uniref:bacteriohemerythrin n=1 Tax=Sulfuricurvum sp. TaxID=2025608 RepID=UPI002605A6C8|nr:hemerythrin family protein [Sulfuricurvum sp.]MDD4885131.1 hemerythrin family protein [Sulfuricurvum sp.]
MATGLEWDESYRLGIEGIDLQHIRLFEIVGRIAALDAISSTKEQLKEILGELSDYMREHFRDEEKYMQSIKYPDYEYHHKLHNEIIDFVKTSVSNAPSIAMIQTKLKFIIKKALIDHIVQEDTKIKLYALKANTFEDDCVIDLIG